MPRERNSMKLDFALTNNDDVQDFIIRMLRMKLSDMEFERDYYESELKVANDQKKVNLSNGRKYSELYKEKSDRVEIEMGNFKEAIEIVSKTEFPKRTFEEKPTTEKKK